MSWEYFGLIQPSGEWQRIDFPLTAKLLRFEYFGDREWLRKYQPSLYLRLRIESSGTTARWQRFWPKDGEREAFLIQPIPIKPNYLEIRKRRDFESLQANYSITVSEFLASPYFIEYPASPLTIDDDPLTIDGIPVEI